MCSLLPQWAYKGCVPYYPSEPIKDVFPTTPVSRHKCYPSGQRPDVFPATPVARDRMCSLLPQWLETGCDPCYPSGQRPDVIPATPVARDRMCSLLLQWPETGCDPCYPSGQRPGVFPATPVARDRMWSLLPQWPETGCATCTQCPTAAICSLSIPYTRIEQFIANHSVQRPVRSAPTPVMPVARSRILVFSHVNYNRSQCDQI